MYYKSEMADDSQFETDVDIYNKTLQESMQLSLKDHLDKLEASVKHMISELEYSKRDIVEVKKDYLEFNFRYHNSNQNFAGMIQNRMELLAKDFDRLIKESRSDLAFLRSQIEKSAEEADTLEKLTEQLDVKISKNERFIGYNGADDVDELDDGQDEQGSP